MKESTLNLIKTRDLRQKLLSIIVIVTVGLGWKYPWIAYSVPIAMIVSTLSLFLNRGRIVCGHFCPRGAFFDRVLSLVSKRNYIPQFWVSDKFRWSVRVALVAFFIFMVAREPLSFERLGYIFWVICTVTTIIGVVLGVFYSHRAWCSFCPIGTAISKFGKDDDRVNIDDDLCFSCGLCDKVCPMGIKITNDRAGGYLSNSDCIKCGECITHCPKNALR